MNFTCPRCGAINQPENPDPFLGCAYCRSSLYIDHDSISDVYTFPPAIEIRRVSLYLKNDFEKIGFRETIAVQSSRLAYFPFWLDGEKKELYAAYSLFPSRTIPIPSAAPRFFHGSDDSPDMVVPVDADPKSGGKKTLYYIPFFQIRVSYKSREYPFFVSAVSGDVYGERLPFIPGEKSQRLFPLFLSIFSAFIIVNFLFVGFIPALLSNGLLIIGFYFLSVFWIGKKSIGQK